MKKISLILIFINLSIIVFGQDCLIYTINQASFPPKLQSINTENGNLKTIFKLNLPDIEIDAFCFDLSKNYLIIASSDNDSIYTIDVLTGNIVYQYAYDFINKKNVIIEYNENSNLLYTITNSPTRLQSINPENGNIKTISKLNISNSEIDAYCFDLSQDYLIIASNNNDSIYAIDILTGNITYRYAYNFFDKKNVIIEHCESDDLLYTINQTSFPARLQSINPENGNIKTISKLNLPDIEIDAFCFDLMNNHLIIASSDNDSIYAIDVLTGNIAYQYAYNFVDGKNVIIGKPNCSTYNLPKQYIQDYNSNILCEGIKNIILYTEKDTIMQKFMFDSLPNPLSFSYKIDTLIQEGIYAIGFSTEIINYIVENEGISRSCAFNRIFHKYLQNEFLRINCIKKTIFKKPQVEISFNYYPEYKLLITWVTKIKYVASYGKGYVYLSQLDKNGRIKIIKTISWTE